MRNNANSFGFAKPSYLVTEDNIKTVKEKFKTEDIQIGDEIRYWDDGGWEYLAGRAGEEIVREGKILHRILTMLS